MQIGVNAQLNSSSAFETFQQVVNFSVFDNSTPCTIKPRRELAIRDIAVVDDPVRTGPGGAWSFGKLMENAKQINSMSYEALTKLSGSFNKQEYQQWWQLLLTLLPWGFVAGIFGGCSSLC